MYSNRDYSFMGSDSITEQFQKNIQVVRSKSTARFEPRIYQLGQIKQYLNINGPLLTQQKRQVIKEKLELDKIAEMCTKERLKDQDYFVRYAKNPFMNVSNKKMKRYSSPFRSRSNTPKRNSEMRGTSKDIVEAVNKIKNKEFKVNYFKFDRQCLDTQLLSSKIKENTRKLSFNFGPKDKRQHSPTQVRKTLSFDDIVNMQDENFYTTHQEEINIFKVVRGDLSNIMTNQILVKYHFNFVSMIDKIGTFYVPIYRDISKLGRSMIFTRARIEKSARMDVLRSSDLTFKLGDIRLGDILNISAGRISPELCYAILYEGNAERDFSPSSTLIQDGDIPYNENMNQNMMNFENSNDSIQQIIDYKKLQNTHEQNLVDSKYHKYYQKVEDILKKKKKICSVTIRDKQLHRQLDKQVSYNLERMIKTNKNEEMTNDRLIRYNKSNKNRSEHIKIRKLLDTIVLKNHQEERINILMNKAPIR